MTNLRIALTLPGVVSGGAFQGGAVAALVVALGEVNGEAPDSAQLDVITGASSGALTAVLAAWTLLAGVDPLPVLHRAWVTGPSLKSLRPARGERAPLSLRAARDVADQAFRRPGPRVAGAAQRQPLTLDMALCSLRPLEYAIRRRSGPPLRAASHLDWATHRLHPGGGRRPGSSYDDWMAATDAAIASASNALAFLPRRLNRDAERQRYLDYGVEDLPAALNLWYTDGSLVDTQPLERCLHVARRADEREAGCGQRVILVVRPGALDEGPGAPVQGGAPRWSQTLGDAVRIITTHSLYADLLRLEKTNSRLRWTSDLADLLSAALTDRPDAAEELTAFLRALDADKSAYGRHEVGTPRVPAGDVRALVNAALRAATGLEGKDEVRVEVVGGGADVFPLGFGGFLDGRARARAFAAGYDRMLSWLSDPGRGPAALGLDPSLAESAAAAAARQASRSWAEGRGLPIGDEHSAGRLVGLAGLAVRSARVAVGDAWRGSRRGTRLR